MKILFLDEVAFPQKLPNFFGLGAILIDSKHYTGLKNSFKNHLSKLGWNPEVEFKGRFIFSHKGDKSISVSKRIEFINECPAPKSETKIKRVFWLGLWRD